MFRKTKENYLGMKKCFAFSWSWNFFRTTGLFILLRPCVL